jgi:hypothetical protein
MIGLSNVAPGSPGAPAPYPGVRNPVKLARAAGSFRGQSMGAKQAGIRQWARLSGRWIAG